MGIEWYRDLSITLLGFVTTVVLIFTAILVYRLYRRLNSTLLLVKSATKIVRDTVLMQEVVTPLVTTMAVIQGISEGFKSISKIFKKGNNEGEKNGM